MLLTHAHIDHSGLVPRCAQGLPRAYLHHGGHPRPSGDHCCSIPPTSKSRKLTAYTQGPQGRPAGVRTALTRKDARKPSNSWSREVRRDTPARTGCGGGVP
jgi:glyoxylase-like metal-dependent hydrolase (beta-lactamase superfamily II)